MVAAGQKSSRRTRATRANVADLLGRPKLGKALGDGVVSVNVSTESRPTTRRWRAASSSSRARRTGDKMISKSCLVVKSCSGVACPQPPAKKTTSTTTSTATTTTSSG